MQVLGRLMVLRTFSCVSSWMFGLFAKKVCLVVEYAKLECMKKKNNRGMWYFEGGWDFEERGIVWKKRKWFCFCVS